MELEVCAYVKKQEMKFSKISSVNAIKENM